MDLYVPGEYVMYMKFQTAHAQLSRNCSCAVHYGVALPRIFTSVVEKFQESNRYLHQFELGIRDRRGNKVLVQCVVNFELHSYGEATYDL